jgi:general nucleoside transport system ATP-binding protein
VTAAAADVALTGISKRYRHLTALDNVDFHLGRGRIHALLGENGAGKSTLMSVAFGLVRPDRGSISINGIETSIRSPRDAIRHGIGMVQQHFSHAPALTVAENVALGDHGKFDPAAAIDRVERTATLAGLALDPFARAGDLPIGAQQRLEIVRALAHDARTLILDEPTAVLSPTEALELLRWLRRFADDGGTVALVTHKVREALAVSDDVTVLRAGKQVAGGNAHEFNTSSLARAMFPEALPRPPESHRRSSPGPVLVTASRLALSAPGSQTSIRDANFELRGGEVTGIAAVEGTGYSLLLRALAGLLPPAHGSLDIPPDVSFIPADRHREALVLELPLFENLALRRAESLRGVVPWRAVRERTREVVREFDVRVESEWAPAGALSGGNQQRFVVGRELEPAPTLLIAENPTRGLDQVATEVVHSQLRRAAAAGGAVVVYSSDLDEVLMLADRILVVHHGEVRDLPVARDLVARAMVGDY